MDAKAEMVVNGTIISIEDFKSEALAFTTWDPWRNIPISILIGSSLVAGGLSRCGIINFLRKGAPKRPVNTNFLIDQALELPSFVVMNAMMLVSYLTSQSIQKMFGQIGTAVFCGAVSLHNSSMSVGGCGIAVYRLLCVKDLGYTLNPESGKKLMKKIIKAELVVIALMMTSAGFGAVYSNDSNALNFGKGHSSIMEDMIHPHLEDETPSMMVNVPFALALFNMLFELASYVIIFHELWHNDNKIKDAIGSKAYQGRRKRNAISLSTQIIGFCLEAISIISGMLMVNFQCGDVSAFLIICSVSSAIISVMHLVGSGEMRKYYFH